MSVEVKKIPLSKIQEQFWILWNLYPSDTSYNIPLVYDVGCEVNIDVLMKAIQNVLHNNDLLRASMSVENEEPYLIIEPSERFNPDVFFYEKIVNSDFSNDLFSQHILGEVHKPFNLLADRLVRVTKFSFNDKVFIAVVFHHIIIDLHSKRLFAKYLSLTYNKICNSDNNFEQLNFGSQYEYYTKWQKEWLNSHLVKNEKEFWAKELDVDNEKLTFFETSNSKSKLKNGSRKYVEFSKDLSFKIDQFSLDYEIMPFVFFLASYAILLSRLSNQKRFCIGVPFSNRRNTEFDDTIGCFINILPLVIDLDGEVTVIDVIRQIRKKLLLIHRHQELPYLDIYSLKKDIKRESLFQTGFTFEEPVKLNLGEVELTPVTIERNGAQLDVFLTLWKSDDKYCGFWEVDYQKITEQQSIKMNNIFIEIIQAVMEKPDILFDDFDIITTDDRNLIVEVNNTLCDYENSVCLHHKFEKQVDITPDSIALISEKTSLTYFEMDLIVNQLANYIIDCGVQIGDVVGICCERKIEMMIAIMAILKTGACYLPLQIDNPSERMDEIIDDSKPKAILSSELGSKNINRKELLINIDSIIEKPYSNNNARPSVLMNSGNLAYILYTSGSTGKPKGTLIEHHSVLNRVGWMQKMYRLTPNDKLVQKTPITFDVSVWELFWWFFNGAGLVLLKHNGEKDVELILNTIEKYGITQIHFVPSMFSPFFDFIKLGKFENKLSSLKNIFLSGEALSSQMVCDFNKLRINAILPQIVNLYGPTEATVDVSFYNCSNTMSSTDKVYIGKPIDNTGLYVVNDHLHIQPVGIKGELIITGVNLSRGYLNRPELTKKVFVDFKTPNGEIVKAYKTGDLALLGTNGELEYIGRKDNQVKIRGMRVELGEIEAKLINHPKVSNAAVVVAFEGEFKSLIGYVTTVANEKIDTQKLRNDLKSSLPSHMIPSQIMVLDAFPLNSSGKINRKALPKPQLSSNLNVIIDPVSDYEMKLLIIWKEILKVEIIGVEDNFFDVGGNSLLALRLIMRINEIFILSENVITIMEHPTVRLYSNYLMELQNGEKKESFDLIDARKEKRDNMQRKKRIRLNLI
ncbi:MAG: amino acid adenylation domain-containing protein [Marinilabiliaceae bacterium]|nr:amino acid adenylation domain-containing protein [Marinilabiliaceae bacterium]